MEKGALLGVVIGLVVAFLVFMAGFYSGSSITGSFFHTRLVSPTTTTQPGQSSAQPKPTTAIQTTDTILTTAEKLNVIKSTAVIPSRPRQTKTFGTTSAGKLRRTGCNVLNVDYNQYLRDSGLPANTYTTFAMYQFCDLYGYNACGQVHLYFEDGSEVPGGDCSTAIGRGNTLVGPDTISLAAVTVQCCNVGTIT